MHVGPVHLVNPLWEACGGSEWRTVETWRLVAVHADARLWSEYEPAPAIARHVPIERISPWRMRIPRGGTLVFVGVYFRIGHWIRFAAPRRVVVIYNTDQPDRLRKNLTRIASCGKTAEVIYTSSALRMRERGFGPVLESLVDVTRFPASPRTERRPFTVGRLSRDVPEKHHEEDPGLWRSLAAEGMRVRIMGGTCLARELAGIPNIELLPAGAEDSATFLRSLDCFVYRTSADWYEAFGRVVVEAMATGLPVACGERGGYSEHLCHGRNSLVFRTTGEALDAVRSVRNNAHLARTLGANAAQDAAALHRRTAGRTLSLLLGDYAANDAREGVDRRVCHPAAAANGRAASDSA
jgi:glycosyltransferase involved in cell wall biosynthesis